MTDRERDLERFIENARADVPSAERLTRTRERLLSNALNAAPSSHGSATGATHVGAARASSGTIGLGLKIAAVSVLLGVGALALRANLARRTSGPAAPAHSATAPVEAPPPAPPRPPAPPMPAATSATPAVDDARPMPVTAPARASGARVPRRPARGPKTAVDPAQDFAREVALLRAAVEAHRHGNDAEARLRLAEHVRAYPNSPLDQERKRLAAELDAKP